jgi:pyridinium-3,5-biscarboxylic acid mononucleotide sulfurtransferase
MTGEAPKRAEKLRAYFSNLGNALIAFSGGVDSSVLAKAAYDALGDKALAVTIDSPSVDRSELRSAKELAKMIGIPHIVIKHDELSNPCFVRNEPDRCYHCKKEILSILQKAAAERGIKTVVEGTNADELLDHRPGYKAVKEAGVHSPLSELGYAKKDIRKIAAYMKLPNAQKPSMACLSSRIPYGTPITKELLDKISKAEASVRASGVAQLRVRCFDDLAVIEVCDKDYDLIISNRKRITKELKALGFRRVTMDLNGYSTGSMNFERASAHIFIGGTA